MVMREVERTFVLKTLFSASISLAFSVIGYLLLGPIGVLGALFQRRLFQDLDRLLFLEAHS